MTDIVTRLREGVFGTDETKTDAVIHSHMQAAADEIERLRAAVAAALCAALREGIEAAALVASRRAALRHSTVAHCHSDRSKKHMQIRADEAGQLVADIRALLDDSCD